MVHHHHHNTHHAHHRKHPYTFGNFMHDIGSIEKPIAQTYQAGIHEVGSVAKSVSHEIGLTTRSTMNYLPLLLAGGLVVFLVVSKK
jgi:hypothetical protein